MNYVLTFCALPFLYVIMYEQYMAFTTQCYCMPRSCATIGTNDNGFGKQFQTFVTDTFVDDILYRGM